MPAANYPLRQRRAQLRERVQGVRIVEAPEVLLQARRQLKQHRTELAAERRFDLVPPPLVVEASADELGDEHTAPPGSGCRCRLYRGLA